MSSMNSLQIPYRPPCLNLTEVENVLISPKITFIKMIKLPVSRMKGIKDKIINVPIPLEVIKETVQSLPRTLEEAEVIPILLKRQKRMVNYHFKQHIRPALIKEAIEYLIGKYPFYDGLTFDNDKINQLKVAFIDDDENEMEEILDFDDIVEDEDKNKNDEDENKNKNKKYEDDVDFEETEEENYNKNDAVKKHQTDVSSSSFLIPENLASFITAKKKKENDEQTEEVVFAPGEGQVPVKLPSSFSCKGF